MLSVHDTTRQDQAGPGRTRQEVIILKSPIWLKLGRKIGCHEHIHALKHQVKIFYFTKVMGKT